MKRFLRLIVHSMLSPVAGRRRGADRPIGRILVWTMRGVGNTIMAVPLFRALRAAYPQAVIHAVAAESMAGVLRHEGVDAVFDEGPTWRDWWTLLRRVRGGSYDIALVAYPSASFRKALAPWIAGIPVRIASRDPACPPDKDFYFFYTDVVEHRPARHDVDANLDLLAPLGVRPDAAFIFPAVPAAPSAEPVIGVHPGTAAATASQAKRWPLDRFAGVMSRLAAERNARFRVFEGPDEEGAGRRLCEMVGERAELVRGAGALELTIDAMSGLSAFIANDSGLAHLAAWRGIPTVVVFGPTDPRIVGPRGQRSVHVESEVDCHPCWNRYASQPVNCPFAFKCMPSVKVDEVFRRVCNVLVPTA